MPKAPAEDNASAPDPPASPATPQDCGVVMPISALDDYTAQHWADVKDILFSAICDAGFAPKLVSDSNAASIIHGSIVQNLYENPIVVCDVSGKNPNVMFELGMRLAFDKPVVIVKDHETPYTFDIGGIEHVPYRRDLRYQDTVDFKGLLAEKIKATLKAASDPSHKTFLKHFGTFTIAKLDSKEVPEGEFILQELKGLRRLISQRDSVALEGAWSSVGPAIPTADKLNRLGMNTRGVMQDIIYNEVAKLADDIEQAVLYSNQIATNALERCNVEVNHRTYQVARQMVEAAINEYL